jgi:two-component system, response regulator
MVQEVEVLLIEDNASDVEMITRALKRPNNENPLFHVKDGGEALDFLFGEGRYAGRETKNIPQVILIDLKMPKVHGKECLMRIKMNARTKKIPVVVLSSSREDADITECYDLGANGYVIKPMDSEEFHKTIANIGSYWLKVNEAPQ